MNWSEANLSDHYANLKRPNAPIPEVCHKPALSLYGPYRSKTEARYAEYLTVMQRAGVVLEWHYEAVTLLLGKGCRYSPDFLVVWEDRGLEFIEVKPRSGSSYYSRSTGKVKIRVAATIYKFWKFKITYPGERQGTWDEVTL
jgi:hypothetical protein